MSDLDLTAARTAAAKMIAKRWNMSIRNSDVMGDAETIVAAVVPLIAAQVRELIAQEIEARRIAETSTTFVQVSRIAALMDAAAIARGEL